jgi:signal recognition particle subunit SRP54
MNELRRLKDAVKPDEILFVADGMTGQDAVKIAKGFDDALGITGVVLTKMDGDARGGAALSIYGVTKKPIKYIGVGEKIDALEEFHPERMAGRILQMGDIVSLVEKAQESFDEDEARKLEKKVKKEGLDLEDFLTSMKQMQKLGPLEGVLKMLPGVNAKMLKQANLDPKRMKHIEAIVLSMTKEERKNPGILTGARRARISKGCGRPVSEVNRLLEQFREMQKMMKKMGKGGGGRMGFPGMPPGMMPPRMGGR